MTPHTPRQISSPGSDLYLGQRAKRDAIPLSYTMSASVMMSHAFCCLISSSFSAILISLLSSCESLFAPASSLVVKLYDSRGRPAVVPVSPDSAHKARLPKQSSAAVDLSSSPRYVPSPFKSSLLGSRSRFSLWWFSCMIGHGHARQAGGELMWLQHQR